MLDDGGSLQVIMAAGSVGNPEGLGASLAFMSTNREMAALIGGMANGGGCMAWRDDVGRIREMVAL